MEGVCRVCLSDDRSTYRVTNTALEQTYDVIIGVKLQLAGRPTALCCVCVSQLRRCRTFVETARESNAALDRWYRTHPRTDGKLSKQLLISCTETNPKCGDVSESQVKQEPLENGDADQDDEVDLHEEVFIMNNESVKQEYIYGHIQSDPSTFHDINAKTETSDDEQDNTQTSDNEQENTQISVVKQDIIQMSCDENDKQKEHPGVQRTISDLLAEVVKDTCGTLKMERNQAPLDQDISSRSLRSGKRIKLSQDIPLMNGHALKQQKPTSTRHHPVFTYTTSSNRLRQNMFSCSQCTYTTASKKDLKQHLKTHKSKKPFACHTCNYKTNVKCSLKMHLMTHTGEKPFACERCNVKFNSSGKLKQHMMTHTGEKPFLCDKCDFRCTERANLLRHLRSHTGEKPYACNRCDFRASISSNLKRHLMSHNGEKPFACDKCKIRCITSTALKKHLMTHTGEKPFACDKCDYKCVRKSGLKTHSIIHTGEKPFACDMCDFRCNIKGNLRTHILKHVAKKLIGVT